MIIDFQFGNFKSFLEFQTFSMRAAHKRKNDNGMDEENVFTTSFDLRMLKTKAIYGANASGKSNIAQAFEAFMLMVKSTEEQEELVKKIWSERFRLNGNKDETPMSFQLIFTFDNGIYRFGFQIQDEKIKSEWLFRTEAGHLASEEPFYFRKNSGIECNEKYITKGSAYLQLLDKETEETFRSDVLFLTSVAAKGQESFKKIREAILNAITIDATNSKPGLQLALHILDKGDPSELQSLKNFMRYSDIGIHDFLLADLPLSSQGDARHPLMQDYKSGFKPLNSMHQKYGDNNRPFNKLHQDDFFKWESKGSVKLLGIGAIVLRTLKNGQALLIDEFDSSLHPNLRLKIFNLFNSKITNPNNAQLIVITHDVGLMRGSKLRRDQIVLVNKDQYGRSTLKTLIEFKGIRKDESFEKEYLAGSYAAVPNLSQLDISVIEFLNPI